MSFVGGHLAQLLPFLFCTQIDGWREEGKEGADICWAGAWWYSGPGDRLPVLIGKVLEVQVGFWPLDEPQCIDSSASRRMQAGWAEMLLPLGSSVSGLALLGVAL